MHDDADAIREKMLNADVLAFATPIYYYEMSGALKTMLDRANPLFPSDYRFREVYALATAAEDEEYVPQRAFSGIEGWVDCFEKAKVLGTLFCGGVTDTGEIQGNTKLKDAYDMGYRIQYRTFEPAKSDKFTCISYDRNADMICDLFSKGEIITLIGMLRNAPDYSAEIIVEEVHFTGGRQTAIGANTRMLF